MAANKPMTHTERIDEIDRMLFDASVMVLSNQRTNADRKITDTRIQLDKLRSRLEY